MAEYLFRGKYLGMWCDSIGVLQEIYLNCGPVQKCTIVLYSKLRKNKQQKQNQDHSLVFHPLSFSYKIMELGLFKLYLNGFWISIN